MSTVKIENRTEYVTSEIAAVFRAVLKDGWGEEGRKYRMEVLYARNRRGCSGYALYGSSSLVVRIPRMEGVVEGNRFIRRQISELSESMILDLARVIAHELEHCRGVRHEDMCDSFKWAGEMRGGGLNFPSLAGLRVTRKVVVKPSAEEVASERREDALEKVAEWERKLALAKTKLSHWRGKVAYYDRRAAAVKAIGPARRILGVLTPKEFKQVIQEGVRFVQDVESSTSKPAASQARLDSLAKARAALAQKREAERNHNDSHGGVYADCPECN